MVIKNTFFERIFFALILLTFLVSSVSSQLMALQGMPQCFGAAVSGNLTVVIYQTSPRRQNFIIPLVIFLERLLMELMMLCLEVVHNL
jgi:hypothetical protein